MEPAVEYLAANERLLTRNCVKASLDSSPEPSTKSPCRTCPRGCTKRIRILKGGSANAMTARSRPINLRKLASTLASPQQRRCLSSSHMSPGRLIACWAIFGTASLGSSSGSTRSPIRASISGVSNPVSPISRPLSIRSGVNCCSSRASPFSVPPGVFGQLVIGKDIGASLRIA